MKRFPTLRKHIAALAAALYLLSLTAIPALASSAADAERVVFDPLLEDVASLLIPVGQATEADGIRLEMLSAAVAGDTAFLHIALSDLTGARVDQTVDLFDSYWLDLPTGCMSRCYRVDYTPATRTATFLLIIQRDDGLDIACDPCTFGVRTLLTNKTNVERAIPEVELASAQINPEMRTDFIFRFADYADEDAVRGIPMLLMRADPDEAYEITKGVTLTKIGFVNDQLRVQFRYDRILKTDNHGFPALLDRTGGYVSPLLKVSYFDADYVDCYEECVFDVSPENVGDYTLYGEFTTSESLIEGDWQVSFSLKPARE